MTIKEYYRINRPNLIWVIKITGISLFVIFVIVLVLIKENREQIKNLTDVFLYFLYIVVAANSLSVTIGIYAFLHTYFEQKRFRKYLLKKEDDFYKAFQLELCLKCNNSSKTDAFKYYLDGKWNDFDISININRKEFNQRNYTVTITIHKNHDSFFMFKDGYSQIINIEKDLDLKKNNIELTHSKLSKVITIKDWNNLTRDKLSSLLLQLSTLNSEIESRIKED